MKKLLLIALLLASAAAFSQTTTITGTIKDLTGTTVTSGQIVFTPVPVQSAAISGTARFDATPVTCLITGTGLKAVDGVSACTLLTTTAASPNQNYQACIMPGNIDENNCFSFAALGASLDISTVIFTPSEAPNSTFVDTFTSQTITGNKTFSGTVGFTGTGSTSFAGPISASSTFSLSENGACSGATAGIDVLCADPTSHAIKIALNGGSFLQNVLDGAAVTLNTVPKFDANGNIVNSSLSDNGTTVSTVEALSTSSTSKASAFIDQSANPAASGVERTGNNVCAVASRNAANSGDVCATQVNASNVTVVGGSAGAVLGAGGNTLTGTTGTGNSVEVSSGGTTSQLTYWCNGVASASSTLFLAHDACTSGNGVAFPVASSGTIKNLFCHATAAGVNASSGLVTVRKNAVNQALTCTFGTTANCSDVAHSFSVVNADVIDIIFTTQTAETLSTVACAIEKQ
jgi:hypothetical protein